MKRRTALAAALALATAPATANEGWETLRRPAAPFDVTDLDGGALHSKDLAGKVVVVDFWATWCTPCVEELPALEDYHRRLHGRADVVLLSFNVTDERDDLLAFVRKRRVGFPVYQADALVGPYELAVFPTKLVIDMRGGLPGMVRFRREGAASVASVEARVTELLGEKP